MDEQEQPASPETPAGGETTLPANLPGQARLRIQIPARARVTQVLPATPDW